ncbi:hypothetical protein M3Y97_00738100 [Aphelenchoides bicaudatus]|nr:hypothetical protein M3Y97_00738100 [Aphelenchoides bicaudatus]
MFAKAMQRQNSMPSAGIPVKLTTTSQPTSANSRRMSHDVSSVKITRPKSRQERMSQPCAIGTRLQSISSQPNTVTISFGYASNVHQYEHTPITKTNSSNSSTTYGDEEQPSTSTFNSPPHHPNQLEPDDRMAEFYVRLPDRQLVQLYCECPCGSEADLYLQSLPEKQKNRLKCFIETEAPDCGEYHIWIKEDETNQITVISLKTLENHFKNKNNRRIKFRHVSMDKISIYRYSVPVITTKFRLRLVHFLSRNYRCCILFVWCLVIFFISIGIVLTVVFGSNPPNRFSNGTTAPRGGQPFTSEANRNLSTTFLNYATNGGMGG